MIKLTKVSIIIPVYNSGFYSHEGDFLRECLDSVLLQTLREIEVICVYRPDPVSLPVLREYEAKDTRLRILTQTTAGMAAARNEGLAAATGEYIAFLDSDDYFADKAALEKLYHAGIEQDSAIVGGLLKWAWMRDGTVVRLEENPLNRNACADFPLGRKMRYMDCQYDFMFYSYIYRRGFLEEHKISFPIELTAGEDNLFHVSAMYEAQEFYIVPVEFYCWRVGHQIRTQGNVPIAYLLKHTLDDLKSTTALLQFSREKRLPWLHWMNAQRINERRQILLNIKNHDLTAIRLLLEAEPLIDAELLAETENAPPPLDVLRAMGFSQYEPIRQRYGCYLYPLQCFFEDYTVGYRMAWPIRKLRGGIACLREHGFGYTIRRFFQKISSIFKK